MKILLSIFIFAQFALATTGLSLVSPVSNQMKIAQPVQTNVELTGSFLKISFAVTTEEINAKPQLKANEYPYQFDVVELFLAVGDSVYPYFEFEVSPYNQSFVVSIENPKKFINHAPAVWTHSAQIISTGWEAEMTIDLTQLGWRGDVSKIKGNLYAITGKSPNRHYWSLSLPQMKKVNFHSPQYFRPLVFR